MEGMRPVREQRRHLVGGGKRLAHPVALAWAGIIGPVLYTAVFIG